VGDGLGDCGPPPRTPVRCPAETPDIRPPDRRGRGTWPEQRRGHVEPVRRFHRPLVFRCGSRTARAPIRCRGLRARTHHICSRDIPD
jgi:hypothetical protein